MNLQTTTLKANNIDWKMMKDLTLVSKCPICSSNRHRVFSKNYDDRYGYPGCFEIWKCQICGHRYLSTQFTKKQINNIYTGCYPNSSASIKNFKPFKKTSGWRQWLSGNRSKSYAWVSEGTKVLDIGCGMGQSLGYYKSINCEAYGVS